MQMKFIVVLFSIASILLTFLAGCSNSNNPPPPPKFYFKASDTTSAIPEIDLFGTAIAISGDGSTLAVGAWAEDGGDVSDDTDNSAVAAGAVYVFKRTVAGSTVSWTQVSYVKAQTPVTGENFGFSVALSEDGNILAVGAPVIAGTTPGSAYVYSGPNYDTPTPVTASDPQNGDLFGHAVALSDDGLRLAVGAIGEDGGAGDPTSNAGAVYVYTDTGSGTNWAQEAILRANTPEIDASFGISVALDQTGIVLAAGASLEGAGDEGAAYVFDRTAGPTWTGERLVAAAPASDDRFGSSVALNDAGDRLAVGVPANNTTPPSSGLDGQVIVFTDSTGWSQEAVVTASNADANDAFGTSVALSSDGNTLLVGAEFEDGSDVDIGGTDDNLADGAGAAYRFTRNTVPSVSWTQSHYIKATNSESGDRFGSDVSITDNGSRFVVGAGYEDSSATGVNSDQTNNDADDSGAAYLWNL